MFSFSGVANYAEVNFRDNNLQVEKVGDGINPFNLETAEKTIAAQPAGSLIIVLAHGPNKPNVEHYLCNGDRIPTQTLFNILAKSGKPMDLVVMSCKSGIAHENADQSLPENSVFLTLTSGKEDLLAANTRYWLSEYALASACKDGTIAFDKFLSEGLTRTTLGNSPSITLAGHGTCEFEDILDAHRNRTFTLEEKSNVAGRFSKYGPDMLQLIEQNSPRTKRDGAGYGFALAVALTASNGTIPLQRLNTLAY